MWFLTDVSGLPIGSIFKVPTDSPETSVSGTPRSNPEDGNIRPDRLWGPMNLLNKYQGLFVGEQSDPCMYLTTCPYLVPRLSVSAATEPTSASPNAFTVGAYIRICCTSVPLAASGTVSHISFLAPLVSTCPVSLPTVTRLSGMVSRPITRLFVRSRWANTSNAYYRRLMKLKAKGKKIIVYSGWLHCAPHCSSSDAVIATFPVLLAFGPKPNFVTDQKLKNFRFKISCQRCWQRYGFNFVAS